VNLGASSASFRIDAGCGVLLCAFYLLPEAFEEALEAVKEALKKQVKSFVSPAITEKKQ
jgi:hypothetical protein